MFAGRRALMLLSVLWCLCTLSGLARADIAWSVAGQSLPPALQWDKPAGVDVNALNTGTEPWIWGPPSIDTIYWLESVKNAGVTAQTVARWGWGAEHVYPEPQPPAPVAPGNSYSFDFQITGPPTTTLRYHLPVTPTQTAADDPFECNWMLHYYPVPGLVRTDTAVQLTTISRFPDDQPGSSGGWARFQIEECAGRVPPIVEGYPDGTYQPEVAVTRDQMAVFMTRALEAETGPFEGLFSDVTVSDWAWSYIEALQRRGIVGGYPDGTYRPSEVVKRDAMAVFVARGIAGTDTAVPIGPSVGHFWDVTDSHWAYKYIEYARDKGVVSGYPDGSYRPDLAVDRGQMAVFVYRGFVAPTGCAVVLGGPNITYDYTLGLPGYYGWTTAPGMLVDLSTAAYVLLDAARLSTSMAPLKVTFDLQHPSAPLHGTITLDAAQIQSARDAVSATGVPYFAVMWQIPAGLPVGNMYTLVTTVNGHELRRTQTFRICPSCP